MKKNRGFTLVELLTVFAALFLLAVVFWAFLIAAVCQGNFWFSEDSVLRELQVDHRDAVRVLKTERNVYSDSVIVVENRDGSQSTFCLDTDVLQNYKFTACKK